MEPEPNSSSKTDDEEAESKFEEAIKDLTDHEKQLAIKMRYDIQQGIQETLNKFSSFEILQGPEWESLLASDAKWEFKSFCDKLMRITKTVSNFQIIEYNLRLAGARVWLMARRPDKELTRWKFMNNPNATFTLWTSMRPLPVVFAELYQESASYSENFDKLALADFPCFVDEAATKVGVASLKAKGLLKTVEDLEREEQEQRAKQQSAQKVKRPTPEEEEKIRAELRAHADSKITRDANGWIQLKNPRYPLPEDELDTVAALLAEEQTSSMATCTHLLALVPSAPFDVNLPLNICGWARSQIKNLTGMSSRSYPTRNLTDIAVKAYNKAAALRTNKCELDNLCCSVDDCPQLLFQKLVIQAIENVV